MPANTKRLFYVRHLARHFAELPGARADNKLDRCERSPERVIAPVLAAAHAIQLGTLPHQPR